MSSKVERKEYQETKVMKTVSPVRSYSSQNLSQFDSNLDYLLDDLQNSVVPRSGTLSSGSKTNSLNRVLRVNAANPVTEYASDDAYSYSSPDGRRHVEGYKKESYSYKTSGGTIGDMKPEKTRVQTSINQLDSLLDDLKEVRKQPLQSSNIDRNEKTVKRELHYDSSKKHSDSGFYTSSSPSSRTSTLTRQVKVKNLRESPIEVVETVCPEINPEILEHLDPSLRPPENTKVTTTIKTYTYEIPGTLDQKNTSDISRKYTTTNTSTSAYSPNESQTTPSKSFVYEKVENFENRKFQNRNDSYETKIFKGTNEDYKPYKKPNPPGWDENTEIITTRNYQPGTPRSDKEYFYNETVTTRNYKTPPPQKKTYIVEEMIDERIENYPPRSTPTPREKTYFVEKTVNERNYINDYRDTPHKETYIYKETVNKNDIPYRNGVSNQPVNIKYKYTTTSSTTNKMGYPHDENDLLLTPPFPTEDRIDAPPKKLDDLMNTIGREPPTGPLNVGFQHHERDLMNEKKAKSMKQATEVEDLQRTEVQKSKNVTGPPVYYPPGEMFVKKEEGAAWRAQGAYAREGGKYEYEASSKEKSKSSSGKAIVPVCLPLCCGLPCTII